MILVVMMLMKMMMLVLNNDDDNYNDDNDKFFLGGDKPYKEVNHETDFYKKGGLIPGSSIGLKTSGKPTIKKPSDTTKGTNTKKLEATYSKYLERLEKEYDVTQVHTLTVSNNSSGCS